MPSAAIKLRDPQDIAHLQRKPPASETGAWAQPKPLTASEAMTQKSLPSPSLMIQDRLMNAREVAARLGVSERWVRDHTSRRNPKIRAIRLGSLIRYKRADVETFMEDLDTLRTSRPIHIGV
jgi:excisionase family DNA binding protein